MTQFRIEPLLDAEKYLTDWAALYARSDDNIFLSTYWLENLLSCAPQKTGFRLLRAFDDKGEEIGSAVFGVQPRRSILHPLEANLFESGDHDFDRVYFEFNDFLIARNQPEKFREDMVRAFVNSCPDVDEFVFRNVRPKLAAAVSIVARSESFARRELLTQPTFFVELNANLMAGFSSSLKAKIRRCRKFYEERGVVSIHAAELPPERAAAFAELERLHAATWARRGEAGVFINPNFRRFHSRLIEIWPDAAHLLTVRVGDDAIGVLYNFAVGDRIFNYQSGFRCENDNNLAPGFLSHFLAAEFYYARGFRYYDLMAGEADYKKRLGEVGEALSTVSIERPSFRNRIRSVARSLNSRVRR